MDAALALRVDVLIGLVSLLLGGVITTGFFVDRSVWALGYAAGIGLFIAVFALGIARESIFSALCSRSMYATAQPHRMLVDFGVNNEDVAAQDDTVSVDTAETPREIDGRVEGTDAIVSVTIFNNNGTWRTIEGTDNPDADLDAYTASGEWTDETPLSGMPWDGRSGTGADVYTLRFEQTTTDRYPGMAWLGPIWVESS